eukprot:TRINITY_DN11199_c0_g1_i2.p2 TRINITY_DN11199_c0_g1~~TRINITY_DN11199_c0_g1_i2.p2  ORF type:complete len:136 (-),score=61.67 TRINITY_DN11199_c0_g1_i2:3-410(-)
MARGDLNSLRIIGEENMKALEEALMKFSSVDRDKELFNEQLKDNELQLKEVTKNVEKVKAMLKENKKQTKERVDKLQEMVNEEENQLIEHVEAINERINKNSEDPMYLSLIHISEPTRQAEISYAVFCLKKKKKK